MNDSNQEQGVYYGAEDYVGLGKRLMIQVVDSVAALALWLVVFKLISSALAEDKALSGRAIFWTVISVLLVYFVGLKRPPLRSLGYILTGTRIVNLRGEPPSLWALFVRFSFMVLGPVNFLVDLFWWSSDPCRQALRDKFAHTYVIKKGAQPLGRGPIVYKSYGYFGTKYIFREVKAPESSNAP